MDVALEVILFFVEIGLYLAEALLSVLFSLLSFIVPRIAGAISEGCKSFYRRHMC